MWAQRANPQVRAEHVRGWQLLPWPKPQAPGPGLFLLIGHARQESWGLVAPLADLRSAALPQECDFLSSKKKELTVGVTGSWKRGVEESWKSNSPDLGTLSCPGFLLNPLSLNFPSICLLLCTIHTTNISSVTGVP